MDCCRAPYNGRRGTLPGVQVRCNERCFGLAVVFAALLTFPCLGLPANADVAASAARSLPAEEAVHEQLAKGLDKGLPGISIALATRQGVIWSGAVGYADLATRSRAHPGYLYGIGSITKVFIACVVQQLIDEGRLRLNQTGSELLAPATLAGIPNADRATVRELLDHTSGVPSWEFDPAWIRRGRGAQMDVGRVWEKAETLDYLRRGHEPATYPPGAGYSYSNTNYTLLGLIIEKVTGHEAIDEVHRRLLAPLGLTDIRFEGFEVVDARRLPARYQFGTDAFLRDAGMHPTFRRIGTLLDVSQSNLSVEWTAGGIVATARDLAIFMQALRDGAVVSPAALKRMEDFRATDDRDEDMGQGLALDRYGHERLIGYTGNVLGFGAVAGWLPDQDLVIVLLTNVGAMHAGESAYYPERLLKETQVIATARALARELEPRGAPATHASLERR
jgi:D-alanyl-D-alanine carboxypeptidase